MKVSGFEIAAEGTKWPSGRFHDVAVLPISDARVMEIFGPFVSGTDSGLGGWHAIGFWLPDKTLIELVRYISSPPPTGFVLRIDRSAPIEQAFAHVLQIVGVSKDELPWINPTWP